MELENTRVAYDNESAGAKKVLEARTRMNAAKSDEERDAIRKEVVTAIDELHKSQGEVPLIRPDVDSPVDAVTFSRTSASICSSGSSGTS